MRRTFMFIFTRAIGSRGGSCGPRQSSPQRRVFVQVFPLVNDRPILLIVGHGSRGAGANVEFEQLVTLYQQRRPEFEICLAYIEMAHPLLAEALAALGRRTGDVTLLPLFLFAAGHVKRDIPVALSTAQRESPGLRFRTSRELGVHP